MKRFYAEQAIWGRDKTVVLAFTTRKKRDEYISTTDYSNAITAKAVLERLGKEGMETIDLVD